MKPRYMIGLLLVVFSFSQTISAQTIQEQLMATWTCDYQASIDNLDVENKATFDAMPTTLKSSIEQSYTDQKITFGNDGVYTQVLANGNSVTGTWQLVDNDSVIKITNSAGYSISQRIVTLTSTQLILKLEDTGMGKGIINNLYFTKN